ncbi:MAG: Uncharacterised protein [Flavobacteriaceae bacterium]|nr:MAG: Uncharacterised protein [Flavobacteriaceae bacterium]
MNKEEEILIIGNGSSVLDTKYGDIIDSYQNVARINNYETETFKENVGQKVNIWFNGANKHVRPRKKLPEKVIVFVPSSVYVKYYDLMDARIKERQNLDKNQYYLVPLKKVYEYEELIKSDRITTGTSSILWAMENYKTVVIHGFDFFIDSKEHYYDSKIKKWLYNNILTRGKKHNTQREMDYINEQIELGKVKSLKNIISDT